MLCRMAGKTRELKVRMKAVGNIQRITKTMQMIATARFQKLQRRATQAKAYSDKLAEVVGELTAAATASGEVDHPLLARGVHRMAVTEQPGFPCRITLDECAVGDSVLLVNHVSRDGDTPYRAANAIFVSESADTAACFVGEVPPVLRARVLSLRGFDKAGMMVDAAIAQPGEAERVLRRLFADERIAEIDVHNATRGCFAARARRA